MPKPERPVEAPISPALSALVEGLGAPARRSVARTIAAGIACYDRQRHLPGLIAMWPAEIADNRPEARRTIVARLARALRAERNRGRAGHWTYDLNRHIALKQAYAAERAALAGGGRRSS